MPACPNCGRQTLRTKDWACQWCGYPLISKAYKVIDKTFRELQEERGFAVGNPQAETEEERAPAPEPPPEPKPRIIPVPRPEPAREKAPPPPPAEVQPPAARPRPEPVNIPAQKPVVPPPAAPAELPSAEAPSKPEISLEPEVPPEPPLSLDSIADGMEISVDQLDALYRSDKPGAHSRFAGKTLVVKGIVDKVFIREHLEIRYIMLKGTRRNQIWSLRCTFNRDDAARASRLNEGDAVMVRGKYDGYSKNIMFKDCVLL